MILGTLLYSWMFLDPSGPFASGALRTGAGVLVCAHIGLQLGYTVELHNGRIWVNDSDHHGSEFSVAVAAQTPAKQPALVSPRTH